MAIRFLYVFFLLIFFSVKFINAQENQIITNKLNENGQKVGKWEVYYENTKQLRYIGQFENDKPTGNFIYYYPSGSFSANMNYKNDSISYVVHYHENGNFMGAGKFINQKKDSIWVLYNKQGELVSKSTYRLGVLTGNQEVYYPVNIREEEKIAERYFIDNGSKHGKWEQFFTDGKIKASGNYIKGSKNGEFIYYIGDSIVEMKGTYINDLKEGKWYYFNSESKESDEVYYIKGKSVKDDLEIKNE